MIYRLTISLITPLHIGSGGILLRDYDFKTVENTTWVLNQDAILAEEFARSGSADWQRLTRKPGELVREDELYEGSPFVRYALSGSTTIEQVREQIKDVYGQCYLPGSSLKGALRTVLMSHAIRSRQFVPDLKELGFKPEWAAQAWERAVFGPDPNHDLLRALVIADSDPIPMTPSPLMLLNAQVFTGGEPGSPIVVEAVKPDVVFHTTMRIDDYLLDKAAQKLGFANRRTWLRDLAGIVREVNGARIKQELAWCINKGFKKAGSIYATLDKASLDRNAFALQLGWGAGWTAKSVATWLPKSAQLELRRRFRLGKPPKAGKDWQPDPGRPFPLSRRLRARRQNGRVVPDDPLGWVLVEMEEIKG